MRRMTRWKQEVIHKIELAEMRCVAKCARRDAERDKTGACRNVVRCKMEVPVKAMPVFPSCHTRPHFLLPSCHAVVDACSHLVTLGVAVPCFYLITHPSLHVHILSNTARGIACCFHRATHFIAACCHRWR